MKFAYKKTRERRVNTGSRNTAQRDAKSQVDFKFESRVSRQAISFTRENKNKKPTELEWRAQQMKMKIKKTKYICRLLLHLWASSTRVIHRNRYHKSTSCVKVSASIVAQTASMLDRRALRLTDDSTARVHRPRRPPISLLKASLKVKKFQNSNCMWLATLSHCVDHTFFNSQARDVHTKKNRSQVLDGVGEQGRRKKSPKNPNWLICQGTTWRLLLLLSFKTIYVFHTLQTYIFPLGSSSLLSVYRLRRRRCARRWSWRLWRVLKWREKKQSTEKEREI